MLPDVCIDIAGGDCSSHPLTPGGANEQFSNRKSSPRAASGHRRKRVCFGAAGLCPTCGYSSPAMCSVIVPATDIMSTVESQVENSGQEEELKGTRRKISLFK